MPTPLVVLAFVFVLPALGCAQRPTPEAPGSARPAPQEAVRRTTGADRAPEPRAELAALVAYRQALMQTNRLGLAQLRALEGIPTLRHVAHHARLLDANAQMLAEVFPPGSTGADSRALPSVWSDPRAFEGAIDTFRSATTELLQAAERGEPDGIRRAVQRVGDACGNCHQRFRAPLD